MSSESSYATRHCVECNRPFTRKPSEGTQRFERRTFCSQLCARALRKRSMNKLPHPPDVLRRLGELGR